jgi:hypothetical protein
MVVDLGGLFLWLFEIGHPLSIFGFFGVDSEEVLFCTFPNSTESSKIIRKG